MIKMKNKKTDYLEKPKDEKNPEFLNKKKVRMT
jgi:hypothetical protein